MTGSRIILIAAASPETSDGRELPINIGSMAALGKQYLIKGSSTSIECSLR
jgi:hypothetical protein